MSQQPEKTGESLITTAFQVQLETATQCDRWAIELERCGDQLFTCIFWLMRHSLRSDASSMALMNSD